LKALGVWGGEGKRRGGGRLGAAWGQEKEGEGDPASRSAGRSDRHRPPVIGHGWQCCCTIEEGGRVRATRRCVADMWDRAAKGPGGQRQGARGGEESEAVRRGTLTRGPGQHSAGARFKLGLNRFKSIQWFRNRFKIPPNFD
jgi:hypothetical protein